MSEDFDIFPQKTYRWPVGLWKYTRYVTRDVQTRNSARCDFTPTRMSIIKKAENKYWPGCGDTGMFTLLVGTLKWCSPCRKRYGSSSKNDMELSYGLAISLLGIYPKELKAGTQTDIWTPVFITAPFVTVTRQKRAKCPLTGRWLNKTWSGHTRDTLKTAFGGREL